MVFVFLFCLGLWGVRLCRCGCRVFSWFWFLVFFRVRVVVVVIWIMFLFLAAFFVDRLCREWSVGSFFFWESGIFCVYRWRGCFRW